jgi:hypothetical protein
MNIEKVVEAVCSMAKDHNQRGDVSIVTLIEESGYSSVSTVVTEQAIENILRKQPDLIDSWLLYSENQRGTPSWYIQRPSGIPLIGNKWIVGFMPGNDDRRKEIFKFKDGFQACAFFIKKFSNQIIS